MRVKWMMHAWTTASSQTVVNRIRESLQAAMQTSCTPRFFSSVSTCSQNLASSPPSPAHRLRMSRSPFAVGHATSEPGKQHRRLRFETDGALAPHQPDPGMRGT